MNFNFQDDGASCVDLCEARIGVRLRVRGLKGQPEVCQRLREMGFCEYAEIDKLADHGALICRICGTRVAVSRRLGREILVEALPD